MTRPVRFNSDTSPFTENPPEIRSTGNNLEFQIDEITQFIESNGIKTLWEKSFLCTCRTKMTKSPDPNCPICQGRGVGYLQAKEVTLAIQSQDRDVSNKDLGLYDSGTAIATTKPESGITFRDRITLPEVYISQSMMFDISPSRLKDGFQLPYDISGITLAVTDKAEPIQEGEDYTVDYEKNIFYAKEHLLRKNVSINITTVLRYLVIDLLKESRYQYTNKGMYNETFTNLPRKLLLKREDAMVNPIPFSLDENEPNPDWEDPKRDMNLDGFFGGRF